MWSKNHNVLYPLCPYCTIKILNTNQMKSGITSGLKSVPPAGWVILRWVIHIQLSYQILKPIIRNPREVCLITSQDRNTFSKEYFFPNIFSQGIFLPQISIQSIQNINIFNTALKFSDFWSLFCQPDSYAR